MGARALDDDGHCGSVNAWELEIGTYDAEEFIKTDGLLNMTQRDLHMVADAAKEGNLLSSNERCMDDNKSTTAARYAEIQFQPVAAP